MDYNSTDVGKQLALVGSSRRRRRARDSNSSDDSSDEDDDIKGPPGPLDPFNCTVGGSGFTGGCAGVPVSLYLHAKDDRGRRITEGGAEVDVTLAPAGSSAASQPINVQVEDKHDGTYIATFTIPARGNYIINVEVEGIPIRGSPFPVYFSAPVDPNQAAAAAAGSQGGGPVSPSGLPKPPTLVPPANSIAGAMMAGANMALASIGGLAGDAMSRTLYIANISPQVTLPQLTQLFSFCGKVVSLKMVGEGRDLAIVEFESVAEAKAAQALDKMVVGDRPIQVQPPTVAGPSVFPNIASVANPSVFPNMANPYMAIQMQQIQQVQAAVMQSQQLAAQVAQMRAVSRTGIVPTDADRLRLAEQDIKKKYTDNDASGRFDKSSRRRSRSPDQDRSRYSHRRLRSPRRSRSRSRQRSHSRSRRLAGRSRSRSRLPGLGRDSRRRSRSRDRGRVVHPRSHSLERDRERDRNRKGERDRSRSPSHRQDSVTRAGGRDEGGARSGGRKRSRSPSRHQVGRDSKRDGKERDGKEREVRGLEGGEGIPGEQQQQPDKQDSKEAHKGQDGKEGEKERDGKERDRDRKAEREARERRQEKRDRDRRSDGEDRNSRNDRRDRDYRRDGKERDGKETRQERDGKDKDRNYDRRGDAKRENGKDKPRQGIRDRATSPSSNKDDRGRSTDDRKRGDRTGARKGDAEVGPDKDPSQRPRSDGYSKGEDGNGNAAKGEWHAVNDGTALEGTDKLKSPQQPVEQGVHGSQSTLHRDNNLAATTARASWPPGLDPNVPLYDANESDMLSSWPSGLNPNDTLHEAPGSRTSWPPGLDPGTPLNNSTNEPTNLSSWPPGLHPIGDVPDSKAIGAARPPPDGLLPPGWDPVSDVSGPRCEDFPGRTTHSMAADQQPMSGVCPEPANSLNRHQGAAESMHTRSQDDASHLVSANGTHSAAGVFAGKSVQSVSLSEPPVAQGSKGGSARSGNSVGSWHQVDDLETYQAPLPSVNISPYPQAGLQSARLEGEGGLPYSSPAGTDPPLPSVPPPNVLPPSMPPPPLPTVPPPALPPPIVPPPSLPPPSMPPPNGPPPSTPPPSFPPPSNVQTTVPPASLPPPSHPPPDIPPYPTPLNSLPPTHHPAPFGPPHDSQYVDSHQPQFGGTGGVSSQALQHQMLPNHMSPTHLSHRHPTSSAEHQQYPKHMHPSPPQPLEVVFPSSSRPPFRFPNPLQEHSFSISHPPPVAHPNMPHPPRHAHPGMSRPLPHMDFSPPQPMHQPGYHRAPPPGTRMPDAHNVDVQYGRDVFSFHELPPSWIP